MHALLSLRLIGFALLVACCLAIGCGAGGKVANVPVSGKVSVNGTPVTSGQVSFIPAAGTEGGGLSAGPIDNAGTYTISTGGSAGAPLGKYKVTVTPSMVPSGGKGMPAVAFNKRYLDSKSSPITIDVVANPAAGHYDLKLTK